MEVSEHLTNDVLRSPESLAESLRKHFANWEVRRSSDAIPISTSVMPCSLGDIRLIGLSGEPFHAVRGRTEIANDDEEFLGVLYQRSGSTFCKAGDNTIHVEAGDVTIWRCDKPAEFTMPGRYDKLCMMIPVSRFESVLHDATSYDGLHLTAKDPLAVLLGSYLSTLSQEIIASPEITYTGTVDVTLELLAAAFRANRSKDDQTPRKKLQDRILRYIETRLKDDTMTPTTIAEASGISVRYLYILFSEQGLTVAGWIRERRLARCRAELEDLHGTKTVAEIAYKWGFSDSAHFSRLFKSVFGVSPTIYRAAKRTN